MSRLKIIGCFIACMVAVVVASSFIEPVAKVKATILIEHFAGKSLLNLDNSEYQNELGQVFTVSRFRYYISNIRLKNASGTEFESHDYLLVDEAVPESKKITLYNVPAGVYSSISFIVGVDSLHNCSGAQSGALDPVNGMFWTWNTGYIFLKLEGHANTSTSPGHIFEYHIGGYAAPNNCIRKVTLSLGNDFKLTGSNENNIGLKADILEILKSPTPVDFSQLSSVTDFHHAATIADNYANMFSINRAK